MIPCRNQCAQPQGAQQKVFNELVNSIAHLD